jgi:hypothetical protein
MNPRKKPGTHETVPIRARSRQEGIIFTCGVVRLVVLLFAVDTYAAPWATLLDSHRGDRRDMRRTCQPGTGTALAIDPASIRESLTTRAARAKADWCIRLFSSRASHWLERRPPEMRRASPSTPDAWSFAHWVAS